MIEIPVTVTKVDAHSNVIERKPTKIAYDGAGSDSFLIERCARDIAEKRLKWTERKDVVRVIVRNQTTMQVLGEATR
jgi:hypothetical protein